MMKMAMAKKMSMKKMSMKMAMKKMAMKMSMKMRKMAMKKVVVSSESIDDIFSFSNSRVL